MGGRERERRGGGGGERGVGGGERLDGSGWRKCKRVDTIFQYGCMKCKIIVVHQVAQTKDAGLISPTCGQAALHKGRTFCVPDLKASVDKCLI